MSPTTARTAAATTTGPTTLGRRYLAQAEPIQARYETCKQQETLTSRGGVCAGPFTEMARLALDIRGEVPSGDLRETADLVIDVGESYGKASCYSGYALPDGAGTVQDSICQKRALAISYSWGALLLRLSTS
ncbi:hypothetical protein PSU4_17180 [Pseudonocardia sulfidoxydans NBRC 16205]|uniref:Uncharacterized protein n=1 Tax=Pseudonocardia sulfidoxydans NBRC 16205 TaxID=1223511 RepID=A0A511DG87_9PSEU|nr:hypothetical protein [Pseudonocardia sulfidoxydans]GEL22764.1 hypothetical protein PSU4_17180 [Pseudonocardia sulfidoxydans NBRC 16205]